MKKSKKMLTICGRIVVSLCVCMAACCAQDYEEMHTVLVSDIIHSIESESDILSETTPITRSISFCEETQCYDGVFLSLYTDYAKSELTTDIIPLDETADIVISGTFITDTSGDMVRLIVRFYGDGIFLSENVQKGITLTECTTDITQNVTIPTECDSIIIAIQAKYDSKKGGGRSDVVEFIGLCVTKVISECKEDVIIEENITADVTFDDTNDNITSDTEFEMLTSVSMTEDDESSDLSDDADTEWGTTFDTIVELCENIDEVYDETNDETSDESSYCEIILNEVTLTELRTDYSKCHIEMSDYIKAVYQELSLELSFCSGSSGDMVRAVVECYDEEYNLQDSITLTGARSSSGEWVINERMVLLSEEVAYIKIYAEAKYETKKGGSKEDIIICKGQVVIHNS